MIRTWYWSYRTTKPVNRDTYEPIPGAKLMVEAIKDFPNDYHFFIITTAYLESFKLWVAENNFNIHYQSKPAYNWRYPENEPKLTAFVLTIKELK